MEVPFVISIDEIIKVGVPFIRMQMDEERDKSKWDDFWGYFENTWIDRYKPTYWNRNEILNLTRSTTTAFYSPDYFVFKQFLESRR